MDRTHRIQLGLPLRMLLAAIVAALAWLALDTFSAASSASAATLPSASSPAGTDDSLLGGVLDTVAPVANTVDGHVGAATALVPAPEPVREAVPVAEVIDAVDTTTAEIVAAVPVVETVTTPVVSALVEPVARPVLESVVTEVADPVLDTVVSPVVDDVVAPVVDVVVAPVVDVVVSPIVETVVAPVVDTVVTPVVDAAQAPVASAGVDPADTPIATPRGSAAPPLPNTAEALPTPAVLPTNPVFTARATVISTVSGVGEAAAVPTTTGAPGPAAPAAPFGTPLSPVALPAPAGGSITGSGSGNGPLSATSTPSGLLSAPIVRFHSSPTASDQLPLAPSFDPGSTPD